MRVLIHNFVVGNSVDCSTTQVLSIAENIKSLYQNEIDKRENYIVVVVSSCKKPKDTSSSTKLNLLRAVDFAKAGKFEDSKVIIDKIRTTYTIFVYDVLGKKNEVASKLQTVVGDMLIEVEKLLEAGTYTYIYIYNICNER